MKKLSLINLFILFFLFSCQNTELENLENANAPIENNPYKVSLDEAKDIALQFAGTMQKVPNASTRGIKVGVESVEVIQVNKATTRGSDMTNGIDTLLYAVNFSDNNGYALVGADKRTEPIFGITDNGSFSTEDIAANPNFAFFLDLALGKAYYDIKKDSVKIADTRAIGDYGNLFLAKYQLVTKWDQVSPYNQYCPGPYTGCVAVALSQILSRFPVIGRVNWQDNFSSGSAILHWNKILTDCMKNDGKLLSSSQSASEVAHLMRYIGVVLEAKYKDDGTSMESKDAINWINKWTSLKATGLKDYNSNAILMAANTFSNKIVYMRGNTGRKKFLGITIKYTSGHAWVADGAFSATRKSDGQFVNLFHFNWGHGGDSNGYFLANVFDKSNPAINDYELRNYLPANQTSADSDDSGTSGNYRYNVEYSIIENPNNIGGGGNYY